METIMISDAAKEVQVETHVLRYWEEELKLPIRRNKQGHRCYTIEDVERFKKIKLMKEQGLQLKAIKTAISGTGEHTELILPKIFIQPEKSSMTLVKQEGQQENTSSHMEMIGTQAEGLKAKVEKTTLKTMESATQPVRSCTGSQITQMNFTEDKTVRLQILLKQLIAETVRETNEELYDNIRQSLLKEIDYQFRIQEEREEAREKERLERDEAYYKRMDELLRSKTKREKKRFLFGKKEAGKEDISVKEARLKKEDKAQKEQLKEKDKNSKVVETKEDTVANIVLAKEENKSVETVSEMVVK